MSQPDRSGPTHLREVHLAQVHRTGLGGCVASGEQAMSGAHQDHVWPLHWLQHATCQLIAHLVVQGATVGVHLAEIGQIRAGPVMGTLDSHCVSTRSPPPSLCIAGTACPAWNWAQGSRDGCDLGSALGMLSPIWGRSLIIQCKRCPGRPEEGTGPSSDVASDRSHL